MSNLNSLSLKNYNNILKMLVIVYYSTMFQKTCRSKNRLSPHHAHISLHHCNPLSQPRRTHFVQVTRMASRRALKAVLIDLSGTLHIEETAVPGAQDALNR